MRWQSRISQSWFWYLFDNAILAYCVTLSLAGIIRNLPIVDIFYLEGFFAYGVNPWSLLIFVGFMLFCIKSSGWKMAPFLTVFAAGLYDSSVSILRIGPVTYFVDYLVWIPMLIYPLLLLRKRWRFSWSLPLYLSSVVWMNFWVSPALSVDTRYILEVFACLVAFESISRKPQASIDSQASSSEPSPLLSHSESHSTDI